MAEGVSHKRQYVWVFVALAVLTAIELAIPEMDMSKFAKGTGLTALAIAKAGVVAWFYMHLNSERGWLKFIAIIPISAFLYAIVVVLESLFR